MRKEEKIKKLYLLFKQMIAPRLMEMFLVFSQPEKHYADFANKNFYSDVHCIRLLIYKSSNRKEDHTK